MTRNMQIGVVVAVAVLGVVGFLAARPGKPSDPPAASSFNPVTVDPRAPRPTASAKPSADAVAADAGVTPTELRNWRQRLDTELCSKGAEQLNKLDGRAPTDPKAINTLSLCLQFGNVAWYKCMLEATDITVAKTCNTRFLQPPPP